MIDMTLRVKKEEEVRVRESHSRLHETPSHMEHIKKYDAYIRGLQDEIDSLDSLEVENKELVLMKETLSHMAKLQKQIIHVRNVKNANKVLREEIAALKQIVLPIMQFTSTESEMENEIFENPAQEINELAQGSTNPATKVIMEESVNQKTPTEDIDPNLHLLRERIGFEVWYYLNDTLRARVVDVKIRNNGFLMKLEYPIDSGIIWNSPCVLDQQWIMDQQWISGNKNPTLPRGGHYEHMEYKTETGDCETIDKLLRKKVNDVPFSANIIPAPPPIPGTYLKPKPDEGYITTPFKEFYHLSNFPLQHPATENQFHKQNGSSTADSQKTKRQKLHK